MRTNVIIDDLTGDMLKVSYQKQRNAVEEGLKLLVQRKWQENIKDLRGKLKWKEIKKGRGLTGSNFYRYERVD